MIIHPYVHHPFLYMDSASTTPVCHAAVESMMQYLDTGYGNPNSVHAFGKEAKAAVEVARHEVADLIGAEPEHIVFGPSATGINRFLCGWFGGAVIASNMEHSSVRTVVEKLHLFGAEIMPPKASPEEAPVTKEDVDRFLGPGDGYDMVSVMMINNETGVVNDVKGIAEACHTRKTLFHTDATAAAGAVPIDVKDLDCDFMTIASHKMYGPKGIAALYVKSETAIEDFKKKTYTGTPNVPAIVGFGTACEQAAARLEAQRRILGVATDNDYERLAASFLKALETELGEGSFALNAPKADGKHFKKILNVRFPGVDAESLVLLCSEKGLMISAGAACESNEQKPSQTLLAMGLTPEEARSSVRVSFSRWTTSGEAWESAAILAECVRTLKGIGSAV